MATIAILVLAGPARAASQDVESGSLTWNVRASFLAYITGPVADGGVETAGGATFSGGVLTFAPASGDLDPAARAGAIAFAGSVRLFGHDYGNGPLLDSTFSDLVLQIDGNTATVVGTIDARPLLALDPAAIPPAIVHQEGVAIATIDLTGKSLAATAGVVTVTDAPAVGIVAAMALVGFDQFYGAELPTIALDPVDFTVTLAAAATPTATATATGSATPSATATSTATATPTATATASPTSTPTQPAAQPSISVSKTTVNAAGDTVTVTGTGFTPSLSIGTRPPLAGQPAGVFIAFGCFGPDWRPSSGSPSTARPAYSIAEGGVKWAVAEATRAIVGQADTITLNPDGSFTATIAVKAGYTGAVAGGNCGIYTYPGSGAVQPLFETYTALTFTGATPTTAPKPPTTGTGSAESSRDMLPIVLIAAVALAGAGASALALSRRRA